MVNPDPSINSDFRGGMRTGRSAGESDMMALKTTMEMGRDTGTCFRAAQHTPIYKKDLFLNAVYTQVCIYGTLSMYSQAVIGSDVMTAV